MRPRVRPEAGGRLTPGPYFSSHLDHIAMAYENAALQAAGVENICVALQKDYVAFKDPDRIS